MITLHLEATLLNPKLQACVRNIVKCRNKLNGNPNSTSVSHCLTSVNGVDSHLTFSFSSNSRKLEPRRKRNELICHFIISKLKDHRERDLLLSSRFPNFPKCYSVSRFIYLSFILSVDPSDKHFCVSMQILQDWIFARKESTGENGQKNKCKDNYSLKH